jgi:hypothetical protein
MVPGEHCKQYAKELSQIVAAIEIDDGDGPPGDKSFRASNQGRACEVCEISLTKWERARGDRVRTDTFTMGPDITLVARA